MSGYSMVKDVALAEGWTETAQVIDGVTWSTFRKGEDRIDIELFSEPPYTKDSIVSAILYYADSVMDYVVGSGKVQQIQHYLRTGDLP